MVGQKTHIKVCLCALLWGCRTWRRLIKRKCMYTHVCTHTCTSSTLLLGYHITQPHLDTLFPG